MSTTTRNTELLPPTELFARMEGVCAGVELHDILKACAHLALNTTVQMENNGVLSEVEGTVIVLARTQCQRFEVTIKKLANEVDMMSQEKLDVEIKQALETDKTLN